MTPQHLSVLDNSSLDPDCVGQRYWYVFLMSSLFTCFGGLIIIYFWRLITYAFYNYCSKSTQGDGVTFIDNNSNGSEIGWVTTARDFCGELISGQSTSGRILVYFF
jgi:hypothetical protein